MKKKSQLNLNKRSRRKDRLYSMLPEPTVILFDVGNTLLFPNWERILAPLTDRGIVPKREHLEKIERQSKAEFDRWAVGGKVDHGYWELFYSHLLDLLHVRDQGVGKALREATHQSSNWDRMRAGTREALERIGSRYPLGIISNADGKIAEALKQCGISDYFSSTTDSGIIGHEKPHPAIFRAALQAMEVEAKRALYVGDVYSVDYVGATNAGMQAVLFDVVGAYRERVCPRVDCLEELQRQLGFP
ncbi:MAG: HAD family hydrolase [Acidobacteria bacterium]|nr:HAD family hydrolase [Acidobacteriota bacterium]